MTSLGSVACVRCPMTTTTTMMMMMMMTMNCNFGVGVGQDQGHADAERLSNSGAGPLKNLEARKKEKKQSPINYLKSLT